MDFGGGRRILSVVRVGLVEGGVRVLTFYRGEVVSVVGSFVVGEDGGALVW